MEVSQNGRKRITQITNMMGKPLSSSKMNSGLDFIIWTALFLSLLKIKRRKIRKGNDKMFKNNVFNPSTDTAIWIKAAGVRAVKTTAQAAVALIPAAVTISQVDWKTVIGTALLAGAVSILTSIAGLPEVK